MYGGSIIERGSLIYRNSLTEFRRRRRSAAFRVLYILALVVVLGLVISTLAGAPPWISVLPLPLFAPFIFLSYRLNMNWTRLDRGVGVYELGIDMVHIVMMSDAFGPWNVQHVFVPWEEVGNLGFSFGGTTTPTYFVRLRYSQRILTCPADLVDEETNDVALSVYMRGVGE